MKMGFLIGNLTKDPEYRQLGDGTPVTNFTVAVNEKGKKAQEEPAEYYKVETWRGLADVCAQSLRKGSKVGVMGKMKSVKFDGQNGQPVFLQVITASEVEFLTPRQDQNGQYAQQPAYKNPNAGYQQGQYQQQYPQQAGQYPQQHYQQQAPSYQQPAPQQQYQQQASPQQQAPPPPQAPQQQAPPAPTQAQPQYQQQAQAPMPDPMSEFTDFPPLEDAELPF